jgi:hypothetical protein
MAGVRPGRFQLELPGVTCEPTPGGSSLAWPVEAQSSLKLEVREGFVTALLALCERSP